MTVIAKARPSAGAYYRGEIVLQSLRTGRRTLAAWAMALAAMIALYAVIWPSIRGNTSWRTLFDTLPQTYRALFTASGTIDLSTPAGYLGVELMGFLGPALFAVYAITAGSAAIAGEEDRGGLEITLSAPVSRTRVLAERSAALVIGVAALMAATAVALWFFSSLFGMHLGIGAISAAAAALAVFGLFCGAVALAIGAATGSAAVAKGAAALVTVASYLINALGQVTSSLRALRPISPYYLVLGNEPLAHGLRLLGVASVLAVAVALLICAAVAFARRDLSA